MRCADSKCTACKRIVEVKAIKANEFEYVMINI